MSERELELEALLLTYERELRTRGVSDEELDRLRGGVKVAPVAAERVGEAKVDEDGDKPGWAQRKFYELKKDLIDTEARIKAVGEFQKRYLDLPEVVVRYRNVRFTAKVDPSEPEIKTVANQNPIGAIATKVMYKMSHKNAPTTREILRGAAGIIEPRDLTLVIGAPGCGKTSFLKLLCGQLPKKTSTSTLEYDECTYNGEDIYGKKRGFVPSKLALYIDQIDIHTPTLTVEETLEFAFSTLGARDAIGQSERKKQLFREDSAKKSKRRGTHKEEIHLVVEERESEAKDFDAFIKASKTLKRDAVLRILGIDHVAQTIVGNAAVRGVSGGQRRRVSIGEGASSSLS